MLNGASLASLVMVLGLVILLAMMFLWFAQVVRESESRIYNDQVDRSFRWGMGWFIFSEVCFFGAFFGALFYARAYSVPWLGGEGTGEATNLFLWPAFDSVWPTNGPAALGGAFQVMGAWGIPALNTIILLTSGGTVTWAHWGILKGDRGQFVGGLLLTVLLGFLFVGLQAFEYYEAYAHLNLKLSTGIYGSTFFMLTGFHGAHVTIGAIMLTVVMLRGHEGALRRQAPFRIRSRRMVLALRGRGLARAVHLRLLALTPRGGAAGRMDFGGRGPPLTRNII